MLQTWYFKIQQGAKLIEDKIAVDPNELPSKASVKKMLLKRYNVDNSALKVLREAT